MWASPSKIPTKTSFVSLGILIRALSAKDKRLIPFVERTAQQTVLSDKNQEVSESFMLTSHNITTMIGLYFHLNILNVSRIVSEDFTKTVGLLVSCWLS